MALASAFRPISHRLLTSQKLHARNAPSPPLSPSFVFFVSYRSTNPSFITRFSIASTVPVIRGSSGGRNPTDEINRQDASSCFDPYDCTKLFSFLSKPFLQTSRWIISRFFFHRFTSPLPYCSWCLIARSSAIHAITFECVKCCAPPRVSHIPSSGSGHTSHRRFTRAACNELADTRISSSALA